MPLADDHIPALAAPTYRFQWEEVQGQYVLLYPEGMIKLSPSAGEIMKRIDGRRSVQALIDDLQTQFPEADLEGDVRRFLEDAHEQGWIRTN